MFGEGNQAVIVKEKRELRVEIKRSAREGES